MLAYDRDGSALVLVAMLVGARLLTSELGLISFVVFGRGAVNVVSLLVLRLLDLVALLLIQSAAFALVLIVNVNLQVLNLHLELLLVQVGALSRHLFFAV